MFSPNSPAVLSLSLVLLTVVALADSQSPAQVGEQCCREDWDTYVGKWFLGLGDAGSVFRALESSKDSLNKIFADEEPEGICRGQLNMKCNPTTKKCECNRMEFFNYVRNPGNYCVGGTNSYCSPTYDFATCKNKFFRCTPNPDWNNKYGYCQLEENAPKGAEEWVEWGLQMFMPDGTVVDMKGGSTRTRTRTQSPAFGILLIILTLVSFPLGSFK